VLEQEQLIAYPGVDARRRESMLEIPGLAVRHPAEPARLERGPVDPTRIGLR
jgi:hypothetical protein